MTTTVTKMSTVAVMVCGCLSLAAAQFPDLGSCPSQARAQDSLNISKYLGEWYEQYAFPTIFEWGQKCVTANYTLKDDGHINVENTGLKNGEAVKVIGDAYRPDDSKEGELLVRFAAASPYGNYWVVDTDYENYTLIYSCGAFLGVAHIEMAWILSRQPQLDSTTVDRLMAKLRDGGVNTGKFRKSDQSDCPGRSSQ